MATQKEIDVAFIIHLLDEIRTVLNYNVSRDSLEDYLNTLVLTKRKKKEELISAGHLIRFFDSYLDEDLKTQTLITTMPSTIKKMINSCNSPYPSKKAFENAVDKKSRYVENHLKNARKYLLKIADNNIDSREETILGTWKGQSDERYRRYNLELTIDTIKGKNIKGKATLFYFDEPDIDNRIVELELKGNLVGKNDYLLIEYKNIKKNVFHFGYSILKYRSDGLRLDGAFVGYGLTSEKVVHGEIELKKY